MMIYPSPNLSKRNQRHKVYRYLLRDKEPSALNQLWGIDVTYIPLQRDWMYMMVAVIDRYLRYIIDWGPSESLCIQIW